MLTPKFSLFVLASYFILPIIALLFPNQYVKLIIFDISIRKYFGDRSVYKGQVF